MSPDYSIYNRYNSQKAPSHHKKHDDPLSRLPLKACTYSNEVGAAISPVNKTLGTLLWAPALLYLGADIYDKYKNEDVTYSPSAKRSLRQVVFQGFAGVVMPALAIKAGQKIGVRLAGSSDSLSTSDKKELIEFTMDYLSHSEYPKTDNKDFSEGLLDSFKQKALENKKHIENKNFLSKVINIFVEPKDPEHTIERYLKNPKDNNPVMIYLKEQADTAIDIMTSEKNIKSDKYKKYYLKSFIKYENTSLARKNTVLKILKDKNIAKSVVATISGFTVLFLSLKPIDFFVENILMEKLVNPLFDKIPTKDKKL